MEWYDEVHQLLPSLPVIGVDFDNTFLIDGVGVCGFASKADKITLAFDPDFPDKDQQRRDLKGSYFHECFHLVQGYTGDNIHMDVSVLPALESGIYEGAATVFERNKGGSEPSWGKYPDAETMSVWIEEVKKLPPNYDWQQWKWFNQEFGEANMLYRVGTYIVDEALKHNSKLAIEDLASMKAKDVLRLSGL